MLPTPRIRRITARTVPALLLVALLATPALAREIHVAPAADGGSNANAGTADRPYETLAHAESQAASGDEIILHAGTYAGDVTVDVSGLTIRSADGEWAVIQSPHTDSGQANALWLTATNCTLRRLEIVGGYYYALKCEAGGHTVDQCILRGSGRDCVKIVPNADGITISRCEIHHSGQRDGSNAEGVDIVNADRIVVRDTYIHDTATNGIYSKGGSIGNVFERLLVTNTGHKGIQLGQHTDDRWFDTDANPDYYENIDGIVRNCIVVNTDGAGISARAALRPKFLHNTCVNVANSFNGGIFIASAGHAPVGEVPTRDAVFRNNIIVLANASNRPTVFITATGIAGSLTMAGNRYYHVGRRASFSDESQSMWGINFGDWQANAGHDADSSEGDPQLDGQHHLQAGSPLIGAAVGPADVTDDYDGTTREGPYDVGADEHDPDTARQTPPPAGTSGTGGDGGGPGPGARGDGEAEGTGTGGGCAFVTANAPSALWLALVIGSLILIRRHRG